MAITAPVLAGSTLAHVASYKETPILRGAPAEMADGSVRFELVQSGAKRDFVLSYDMLTTAQKATLITAWTALATSYSASNFTSIDGTTYTVTRHPDQKELAFDAVSAAGPTLYWKAELKLREV
jgi:hypothetical protein